MFKEVLSNPNFPEMEKSWLAHWYESGVVNKYLHKNDNSSQKFSFIDGPITANNPMGVHHAWGRTYKDLWQRFFNLQGYRQRFQNGFDCQGLWVEVEVEKSLGLKSKKDIEELVPGDKKASIAKFVELCKERANKFAGIQTEQSKRLGYFMDWENSYYTMSEANNYMIWHFLKKCFENGWIYKGHESVPWCPRCETAISQHEILTEDYKEVTHDSIYFELPLKDSPREFLLVWTTTPWTIPANNNVAVDPNIEYSLVAGANGDKFWLASALVTAVFKGQHKGIVKTSLGSDLVGKAYTAPFYDLPAVKEALASNSNGYKVVANDPLILPISTTEGTGLVHLAASAGTEDFLLGKKLNLPMIPIIADNADYLPNLGFLAGLNAKKNPQIIIEYLSKPDNKLGHDWVFEIVPYKHRYPACWRCKSELVWKVADEWYIAMDKPQLGSKDKRTLRERMVDVTKQITWLPEFGLDRELDWLKNMHDWLISKKNRYWGLALPIYECATCGRFEVLGSREELKERAVGGWEAFERQTPHKPWIDEVSIECRCGGTSKRIPDVGNPWLDAGIVPYSTLSYTSDQAYWEEWFPADFITESFPGQFKNWFYSLIAMSTVLEDTPSFKKVLGFGTLVAENGQPMHKSSGNFIEFNEAADKIGVDVIRWLYLRQNPEADLPFGYKPADEVRRQFYLTLWNSYKFFVDYATLEASKINDNVASPNILDQWILSRLTSTSNTVKTLLSEFNARDASLTLEKFVQDLSTWYIRLSRERLWSNSEDVTDKNHFYSTLNFVFINLSIILSPFLPFISEEIFVNLTGKESVHLESFPDFDALKVNKDLEDKMQVVREVVEAGRSVRKASSIKVRQPLSNVTVSAPLRLDAGLEELIKKELNVKDVVWGEVKPEITVSLGEVTPELQVEGDARDLMRIFQDLRKQANLQSTDKINAIYESSEANKNAVKAFNEAIKRKIGAVKLDPGTENSITKLDEA